MKIRGWMVSAMCLLHGLALGLTPFANAETYNVLYRFTGGNDGAYPVAGVTVDSSGNVFGTASAGGNEGEGTVFHLVHSGRGWSFYLLYAFQGWNQLATDGGSPYSRPVIGPDGALYGTTHSGADGQGCRQLHGCGSVYRLQPKPGNYFGLWQEDLIFQFGDGDGSNPDIGDVVFDRAGNLYGTTRNGGANEQGAVYELTFNGGAWSEQVIHSFAGSPDGAAPLYGPVIDQAGNLYGTTTAGGTKGWGTVYQLTPAGSGWAESVVHSFQNGSDGLTPISGVILDGSGNLYGNTQTGGANGGGTVFELTPSSDGSWSLSTLYGLPQQGLSGPYGSVVMDNAGNLYGTTSRGGANHQGSVFKLTRSNGLWIYRSLHDFTGGDDGGTPYGSLSLDTNGNIFGTTYSGGWNGNGVVFEIIQ